MLLDIPEAMSLNRYAQRRDGNESDLVKLARQCGAEWVDEGPLDGWIFWRGDWTPVEIKVPSGRYTQLQKRFLERCRLNRARVWTWRTGEDVLRCFQG